MSNKEIVKAVLRETTLFNGAASVSEYSNMRRTVSVIHSPDCPCNRKDGIPVGIGKEVQE